jgi:hypothetical protein
MVPVTFDSFKYTNGPPRLVSSFLFLGFSEASFKDPFGWSFSGYPKLIGQFQVTRL